MSLNKIIRKLKRLATDHPSINQFGVGNRYDLFGYEGLAPYLWVINDNDHSLVYSEDNKYNVVEYVLTLRVGDYVNNQVNLYEDLGENSNNELDVSSDTAWILMDLIAIIANNLNGEFGEYNIVDDISLTPFFREEQADISGHEATIVFRTTFQPCSTPLNT